MKKTYNKPTAEKLAFKYRDQVVAASGDSSSSPSIGSWTSNPGSSGCNWHVAEAWGVGICDIL